MRRTPLKRYTPLRSRRPRRKTAKRTTYTKELREYIRERDEYCRVCGGRGDQVHHVIPRGRFKVHPERYTFSDVHDERNLMWICWRCHNWAHHSEANLQAVIALQEQRFGPLRKAA
ncbi:HNH endonuclease signature motif containing protein [Alicyclobacillus contaminans]|uniref:HNH endonuclease signature motif containing protein n=1 Tax=Alicyclobacillus contaminans TaxID=392016 RepID=UPI0003FA67CD|nr:HNH endonuclease signature motif containing protein [Alicyclobacillus contaminans]